MPGPNASVVLAASALVKTGPGVLFDVILTGGSDAATLILYDNTAGSGTQISATIKAATLITVPVSLPGGVAFANGIYAAITGTAPSVAIVYR